MRGLFLSMQTSQGGAIFQVVLFPRAGLDVRQVRRYAEVQRAVASLDSSINMARDRALA